MTANEDTQYAQGITLTQLQEAVDRIDAEEVDLSPYALESRTQSHLLNLQTEIGQLTDTVGDLSRFATTSSLDSLSSSTTASLATKVTQAELDAVEQLIPSLDDYATQAYVASEIAAINALSTTGGVLTGALQIRNATGISPGLDFSQQDFHGYRALALKATEGTYAVNFGSTNTQQEIAFEFQGNEDLCWIHDGNKIASVASDGFAAHQLYLVDFGTNTFAGRTLNNTIDVRARLATYQSAFEQLRQGASNATDFESLKSAISTALQNV